MTTGCWRGSGSSRTGGLWLLGVFRAAISGTPGRHLDKHDCGSVPPRVTTNWQRTASGNTCDGTSLPGGRDAGTGLTAVLRHQPSAHRRVSLSREGPTFFCTLLPPGPVPTAAPSPGGGPASDRHYGWELGHRQRRRYQTVAGLTVPRRSPSTCRAEMTLLGRGQAGRYAALFDAVFPICGGLKMRKDQPAAWLVPRRLSPAGRGRSC